MKLQCNTSKKQPLFTKKLNKTMLSMPPLQASAYFLFASKLIFEKTDNEDSIVFKLLKGNENRI
jgi:hypothetical protein